MKENEYQIEAFEIGKKMQLSIHPDFYFIGGKAKGMAIEYVKDMVQKTEDTKEYTKWVLVLKELQQIECWSAPGVTYKP